jgi:hypothetical protein
MSFCTLVGEPTEEEEEEEEEYEHEQMLLDIYMTHK